LARSWAADPAYAGKIANLANVMLEAERRRARLSRMKVGNPVGWDVQRVDPEPGEHVDDAVDILVTVVLPVLDRVVGVLVERIVGGVEVVAGSTG
jgi:hypothetical protein